MAFLVVYSLARGVAGAAARPFWFDEFLTLSIASQASLHDLWTAITRGFDTQPPLFYLLERACLALPVSKEIALRLPSILSFPVLLMCVFTFVKDRAGQLIAFLCVFVMLSTSLFHLYLIEARGYMLMSTCIAFAVVSYQRSTSPRWTAIMGVSLFLAQSFHYYAVFAMVPFGLAEIVFLLRTRRFRWQVWAALLFGVLPLIVFWPLLTTIKVYYGSQVFSRLGNFSSWIWIQYYGLYFFVHEVLGVGLASVSIATISCSRIWALRARSEKSESSTAATALPERVLFLALTLLPLILFGVMRVIHGALLDRYALPATIGLMSGVASALYIVGPRGTAVFALFIAANIGMGEIRFWRHHRTDPLLHEDPYSLGSVERVGQIERFVRNGGHEDLAVVYAHAILYGQVIHYSPGTWTRRLVCLVSQREELKYENTDTMFLALKGLGEFYPIRLADYDEFTATHPEFLMYADRMDWPLRSLSSEATSMQLLRMDGDMMLYLVKMKKNSAN